MGSRSVVAGALLAIACAARPPMAAAGARVITFEEALLIAGERSTTLARAENAVLVSRLGVEDARMQFLPDLSLRLSGSESWRASGATTGSEGDDSWSGSLSAGVSSGVTLFDGFARSAGLRAARLEEAAGCSSLERARQTVVSEVISGYLTLIAAREELRVREENLAAQKDQERLVRALVGGGERPISDQYQQESSVAAAEAALVEAKQAWELSRVDLVRILQLPLSEEVEFLAPSLPADPQQAGDDDLDMLLRRAFDRRPDLAAAASRVSAAHEEERVAAAGRWPGISLSADLGSQAANGGGTGLFDQLDKNRSASADVSLSMPLWDRSATSHAIERARIVAHDAELTLADLRQEVAIQVRRALLDRDAAREGRRAAEAQVRAAEKALDAMQERYEAGAATLFEVSLARADMVQASSSMIQARYNQFWKDRLLAYYVGDLDPSMGLSP